MQSAIPDLLRSAKPGWSAGCRPKLSMKHFITDLKNNSPYNKGQIIAWKPLLMPNREWTPETPSIFSNQERQISLQWHACMLQIVAIALAARCMWCAVVHMASSQIIWWMLCLFNLYMIAFSLGKEAASHSSRLVFLKRSHHARPRLSVNTHVCMRIDMYAAWSHYRD